MGLRLPKNRGVPSNAAHRIGRYTLREVIAVGDETAVHLGFSDEGHGFRKPVAIKRLLPRFVGDRDASARLAHEARLLAYLQQPNIVSLIDLFDDAGATSLVTDYVVGETVAGVVQGGRCPLPVAVAIIGDVLRGLEAAHAARGAGGRALGIVHRDVRPENLVVGADGVTRVLDFGSACSAIGGRARVGEGPRNTDYAAPEQLLDRPIDRRADVFAAAVVLWEILTGKRLFRIPGSRDAFLKGTTRYVIHASAFNSEVPKGLDIVMLRALSLRPERRFDTASEFAAEIEAVVRPTRASTVADFLEQRAATSLAWQRAMITGRGGATRRPHAPSPAAAHLGATVRFTPDQMLLKLSSPAPSHIAPSRRWSRPGRSTLLAGCVVGLLVLLVGVRLSLGTTAVSPPSIHAVTAQASTAPASTPHASPARSPEPVRAPEATQWATRLAAAASDLRPSDTSIQIEAAILPADARSPGAIDAPPSADPTATPKPAPRKAPSVATTSCDPPFTLDSSGIKRLKLHCL
jgi:serine/threonine protein kinase